MDWINVQEALPIGGQIVSVYILELDAYGIAEYSKYFGFQAEDSAYDIYCHDDSGLTVSLDGEVTHWSPISKPKV